VEKKSPKPDFPDLCDIKKINKDWRGEVPGEARKTLFQKKKEKKKSAVEL